MIRQAWAVALRELRAKNREVPLESNLSIMAMVVTGMALLVWAAGEMEGTTRSRWGMVVFGVTSWLCLLAFPAGGLAQASVSLTTEREQGAWVLLQTTALHPSAILAGKLAAILLTILARFAWFVLPALLATVILGGVNIGQIAGLVISVGSLSILGGSIGLLISAHSPSSQTATSRTGLVFAIVLCGGILLPMVTPVTIPLLVNPLFVVPILTAPTVHHPGIPWTPWAVGSVVALVLSGWLLGWARFLIRQERERDPRFHRRTGFLALAVIVITTLLGFITDPAVLPSHVPSIVHQLVWGSFLIAAGLSFRPLWITGSATPADRACSPAGVSEPYGPDVLPALAFLAGALALGISQLMALYPYEWALPAGELPPLDGTPVTRSILEKSLLIGLLLFVPFAAWHSWMRGFDGSPPEVRSRWRVRLTLLALILAAGPIMASTVWSRLTGQGSGSDKHWITAPVPAPLRLVRSMSPCVAAHGLLQHVPPLREDSDTWVDPRLAPDPWHTVILYSVILAVGAWRLRRR